MVDILKYHLENIATLRMFYESMLTSVLEQSKRGKEEYKIGHTIDIACSVLVSDKDDVTEEAKAELRKTVEQFIEIVEIDKTTGTIQYRVRDEVKKLLPNNFEIRKTSRLFMQYSELPIIHSTNTLIALITRFEEAISAFLHELFLCFPEKYLNNKEVKYEDIIDKTSDEVKEFIIRHEIESVMWKSYKDWFSIFQSHNLSFDGCKIQMDELCEIYARRNVWVHNSGRVNETYLNTIKNCKKKIGYLLSVDEKYISQAFLCVKIILYILYIESIKLYRGNKTKYAEQLFEITYEELQNKDYKLCSIIFPALNNCPFADEGTKTMSKVNYWIAMKALGQLSTIQEDIEHFDVSVLTDQFKIAKLILLDRFDDATKLIEETYNTKTQNGIGPYELIQWPLFMDYRKTKQFREFRKKHLDDFMVEQIVEAEDEDNGTMVKTENEA